MENLIGTSISYNMNKVTKFYQDLIDVIKESGWKVQHITKNDFTAEFRPKNQIIVIHRTHRNTLFGCIALGHEIGHMVDFMDKKFDNFFYAENGKVTDKKLIKQVEWSATQFSKQLLHDRGFDTNNMYYLSKEYFNSILPDWYEMYSQSSWRFSPKK